MTDIEKMQKAHSIVAEAMTTIWNLRTLLDGVRGVSIDTAVAAGESVGAMGKAKALLGRDIDEALQLAETPQ